MTIEGLLFDKDGTILDYARTWVPINREAALFAAGGDSRLAEELLAAGGHDPLTDLVVPGSVMAAGTHDEIADVFARHLGSRSPSELAQHIERIFHEGGAKHSVLIAGAAEAIARFNQRGFRLGVATNDSIAGLQASLGRHGLLEAFMFHAGCDSGFGVKPAPGMVQAFCAATGLAPSRVAVVGDAAHDLEMGRRAGVALKIGVLCGTSAEADLAPFADLIVPSIVELEQHL